MVKHIAIVFVFAFSVTTMAQNNSSSRKDSVVENSLSPRVSDQLTDYEKDLAKQWMLKESDWVKYKKLMDGPRGTWSPGLDPITALGVSETSESERKRYADIWMKVETRKVELELAFEVERMAAAKRLHGDAKLVRNDDWIEEWRRNNTRVKTKISAFVEDNCIDDCKNFYRQLSDSVGDNAVLDIYFAPGATAESAGKWAESMNIDPAIVKTRKITLNFDQGTSEIMDVNLAKLPQVRVLNVDTGEVSETFKK